MVITAGITDIAAAAVTIMAAAAAAAAIPAAAMTAAADRRHIDSVKWAELMLCPLFLYQKRMISCSVITI